jgi:hypothetical protein
LGIEVIQNPKYIFISQKKYVGELLSKFDMIECNPISTPMEQNLNLTSKEGSEFEDATKYRQLVGSLTVVVHTVRRFPIWKRQCRIVRRFPIWKCRTVRLTAFPGRTSPYS